MTAERRRWFRTRLADRSANTLIEAAIVTPLLILVTLAVVDFSSLLYVYLALENGVSQATRFAVTGNQMEDPDSPGTSLSREASIKATMRRATPTLTIGDGAFSFSHMPVGGSDWVGGTGGPSELEKVSVDYTWNVLTPLMRPFFTNGQIHIRVDSAMKNEGRFQ